MDNEEFNAGAKWLHWLVALFIFILLPLGWTMVGFTGDQRAQAIGFHKALGITVLALVVIRVLWRLNFGVPELPASLPQWQKLGAKLGHLTLYALILAMPLSGWAMSSAANKPISLFGLVGVPYLPWLSTLPPDIAKSYGKFFAGVHGYLAYALAIVVAGHVLMALHHAFKRDGIFSRMLPGFLQSSETETEVA